MITKGQKIKAKEVVFNNNGTANIPFGAYKVYWKSGGWSIGVVGYLPDGTSWIAISNWTNLDKAILKEIIPMIKKLKLIVKR